LADLLDDPSHDQDVSPGDRSFGHGEDRPVPDEEIPVIRQSRMNGAEEEDRDGDNEESWFSHLDFSS
jgi:hypothetical protein